MRDVKELCRLVEEEIGKIAEKGLQTNNFETAFKLVDMYKDMKNIEYWETKEKYYTELMSDGKNEYSENRHRDRMGRYSSADGYTPEYDHDSSYGRRGEHYVRGHYSRADMKSPYDGYMMEKQSYRSGGRSEDCKRRMLTALEDHLEMLTKELGDMATDADCIEERETLKKYIEKLRKTL